MSTAAVTAGGRPRAGWRLRGLDPAAVRRFHVYADVLLVSAAWLGAWATRRALDDVLGYPINPFATYLNTVPLIVPPWLFSCWIFGIYQTTRMGTVIDQIQNLFRGVLLGLLVTSSLAFLVKELHFGRVVVGLTAIYALALQGLSRAAFYHIERRMQRSGRWDLRTLVLGAGTMGIRLLQKIQDHPEIGHRVVAFLDDDPGLAGRRVGSVPVLGRIDRLRSVVVEHRIEEVFVAVPKLDHGELLSLVLECEDRNVTFRVVTNLFEVLTASSPVDLVDDLPLVRLGSRRAGPHYEPAKRVFDVAVSMVLLVASTPLWLWWALRIRLDSPGPVFFAQMRVGEGGRTFRMLKFRTMRCDVDPYVEAPRRGDDPRITSYGRWLRSTSIDEIPQLLNVIRGEMSLVGPRPEMPFIVETYDEWKRRRLTVKPGITGLWQILGRKDLPMHENLQYDFYYIRNRSLWLDLSILVRTLGTVLSRRGAF